MRKQRKEKTEELIEKKNHTKRRYPFPTMHVDRTGMTKALTLELLMFNLIAEGADEWFSPKQIFSDSLFEALPYKSERRCLSMRLLRYYRQGLVHRKRFGRVYKYQITEAGMARLNYLWDKFGMLSPPTDPTLTGEELQIKTRHAEVRSYFGTLMNLELSSRQYEKKTTPFQEGHTPIYDLLGLRIDESPKSPPAFRTIKRNPRFEKQLRQREKKGRPIYDYLPIKSTSIEESLRKMREELTGS